MHAYADDEREWLEADGLGGFASGTVCGRRTRRYHAWLLTAATPPTGRAVLVNGAEVALEMDGRRTALSSQRYVPGVIHPDGASRLVSFAAEPWPCWRFDVDGVAVTQELVVLRERPAAVVRWRLVGHRPAGRVRLSARPLLSVRDYHATHHENGAVDTSTHGDGTRLAWCAYEGLPRVWSGANATFTPKVDWYRQFLYEEEARRGLDAVEDLWSPGELVWDLARGDAYWLLTTDEALVPDGGATAADGAARDLWDAEAARRRGVPGPRARAVESYLVRRGSGRTVIAGYPWFTDWGRDTFIALRGLCLATGRLDEARDVLLEWADAVSEGMLPNRFPDGGTEPEFNAVDASLWYVVAVGELLAEPAACVSRAQRARLRRAVRGIVEGYHRGTRHGIRADEDGLLAAGAPGLQLTWMDAKVGDWVVTPRAGKPVEVQALWINALEVTAAWWPAWRPALARARAAFDARFWNPQNGALYDVVDVDHVRGTADATVRPNQILAVGGLPVAVLSGARARAVVDVVERELLTPLGLRSLARGEAGYAPHYTGDGATRDAGYHRGTVWPWLMGPFVQAWLRVHGDTPAVRHEARARFLRPLQEHLDAAGLGHVSEVADAEPPFTPGGCPFQAWSLGELLRIERWLEPDRP